MDTATLNQRAMLVEFTARRWGTRRQDKALARKLAEAEGMSRESVSAGLRLVRKEHTDALDKAYNAASAAHREATAPWTDKGARVLASAGYDRYKAIMHDQEDRWWPLVDELMVKYEDGTLRAEAQQDLNGSFNPADFPPARLVRAQFALGSNVFPFPAVEDFRLNLSATEVELLRQQLEQQIVERMQAAEAETWQRMAGGVLHMIERLRAYQAAIDAGQEDMRKGSFHDTLVENLRELVATLPGINVTGNATMEAFQRRIGFELTRYNAATLKASHDKRQETLAAAEAIHDAMSEYLA